MSRFPLILLPPSEGKAAGGGRRARDGVFGPLLGESRATLISALAELNRDRHALERVTRVSGVRLERARDALEQVVNGHAPLLATWRRYTGVVWTHLDPSSLAPTQRRRLMVPSALYGITAGEDLIADYRLTFHASVADCGQLASFWREPVTDALIRVAGRSTVIDLLPAEHRRALDLDRLAGATRVISVRFQSSDGARAIGHAAKAVKGLLARRLLDEGVAALSTFVWGPWRATMLDDRTATVTASDDVSVPSL